MTWSLAAKAQQLIGAWRATNECFLAAFILTGNGRAHTVYLSGERDYNAAWTLDGGTLRITSHEPSLWTSEHCPQFVYAIALAPGGGIVNLLSGRRIECSHIVAHAAVGARSADNDLVLERQRRCSDPLVRCRRLPSTLNSKRCRHGRQ